LFRAKDGALPSLGGGGWVTHRFRATDGRPYSDFRLGFSRQFAKTGVLFYVYILQSADYPAETYRGHAENLRQRLSEHNAGKCPHTSKFKPWNIKFYGAFETLELSRQYEIYLKSGSGHAFQAPPGILSTRLETAFTFLD
jgi:putative endonuclease